MGGRAIEIGTLPTIALCWSALRRWLSVSLESAFPLRMPPKEVGGGDRALLALYCARERREWRVGIGWVAANSSL